MPDPDLPATAAELRRLIGRLRRTLREQVPPGDLSWPQMAVLGQLDRAGPATVTQLAAREGMRPQSMGAIVASLQAAGLVVGTADPADGRRTLLSITPACAVLVRETRAARDGWLVDAIASRLTSAEQATLAAALPLLARLIEP